MAKIVVVEDDVYMREELLNLLEKSGYDTIGLSDFENAVSEIAAYFPDLILLDINLPFRSGFEICKELKAKQIGTVLVLTARDKLQDELHALDLGADDYLTKPCNMSRLLARIKNLLRRKEEQVQQGLLDGGGFLLDPNTFTIYVGNGFNIYQGLEDLDPAEKYGPYAYPGSPKTSMDWNVTPEVLYWSCRFLYERYGKPIMITENGMSCFDWVSLDGKVHDPNRIDFLHRYLRSIKDAVSEGIPVLGYQYWSIMDNFEWINGYDKRFGLVYVDYRTQKRTIKDSAYWYRDVIASNGGNL